VGLRIHDARGDWKYVEDGLSRRELYDLAQDPFELQNLSGDPAQADFLTQLAAELAPRKGLVIPQNWAPQGKVGKPYSFEIPRWGGVPPYVWQVEGGSLPEGLSLDAASGVVSGTPLRQATLLNAAIRVTDSSTDTQTGGPQSYSQQFRFTIAAKSACGLGSELVLLAPLYWLGHRRRRRCAQGGGTAAAAAALRGGRRSAMPAARRRASNSAASASTSRCRSGRASQSAFRPQNRPPS
jgi:hypothetical protein